MKRLLIVCLLVASTPAFAEDARTVKRQLIRELLDVIDSKALTQSMLDIVFDRIIEMQTQQSANMKDLDAEQRKEYESQMKKYSDQLRVYRERLFARIDYAKYAEEVYAPIFEKRFTAEDLSQLIAFYKTPVGQKNAKVIPELAVGGMLKGTEMITEISNAIGEEMANEENAAKPWKKTMADLRTVATAAEAYATDENKYPAVKSYGDLKPILSPTYVRELPEKDSWGTPYMYVVSADGQHYRFVSAGADKRFDWNAQQIEPWTENAESRVSESLDKDIIFQDGVFIQVPAEWKKNPE